MRFGPLVAAAALFTIGCDDPIVGVWQRDEDVLGCTERPEFQVLDDMTGVGDYCACDFDFRVEQRSDERYRFDVNFEGVCGAPDGRYDCDLLTDDELDCDDLGEFVRIAD